MGVHWDIYFEESLVLSSIIEGHVPHDIAGEERREGRAAYGLTLCNILFLLQKKKKRKEKYMCCLKQIGQSVNI